MKRLILVALACLAVSATAVAQKTPFSRDSAYAFLDVLVNKIGPRPMGSPAERAALDFAAAKFKEYGCQESYVMPITYAVGSNTRSGVAVGVRHGRTGRIILIGGHIDSAGPDIPGANDDGSGAASVIELARVLAGKEHESTVVFCCWGGEEKGLCGSEFFAANSPLMDSIALMLQIDMSDGSGIVMADPDAEDQVSAPRWLVESTFDIFYNDLKHEGLVYPTQSATINASTGSTGSDHIPFLRKGIPAIDFTSDVSYPIHSPLDNWKNFNPSGLARTGDLVYKLFEKYDAGVPPRSTAQYLLVVFGSIPVFISHTVISIGVVLAVLLAILAFVFLSRDRIRGNDPARVRWSTLKLLLFTIVIQAFMWSSENVVGFLKGYRYPWVNNYVAFVWLGVAAGLLGLWLCLRLAKRLPLSADPYVYYLRSAVILLILTGLLYVVTPELAMYPALTLGLLALAVLVPSVPLKGALSLLMPLPMVKLVFQEYVGLFQRVLTQSPAASGFRALLYNAGFILVYAILSLPLVYAFAAIYRSAKSDLFWLKKFRGKAGLVFSSVAVIVLITVLMFRPVYDEKWEPQVRVTQQFTMGADSGTVMANSGEYLKGVRFRYDGRDTTIKERTLHVSLPTARPAIVEWLNLRDSTHQVSAPGDTLRKVSRVLTLISARRPYTVTVSYRSASAFEISSPWQLRGKQRMEQDTEKSKTYTWYAFPDTLLVIPVTFALRDTQKIRESIEVVYDSLAYPITMDRDLTSFTQRTVVNASRTFGAE
jgi:hypothetical protein